MSEQTSRNLKLGIFVISGTLVLVVAMYLIGAKQNLFGGTFTISTRFRDVSGLMSGNNVRFAGIDIGTVQKVSIINDTTIDVEMVIKDEVREHIKKNALASIGTDGLMGNKLVNIVPQSGVADQIEEGDVLLALDKTETKDMINTLNASNDNVKEITDNLKVLTQKLLSSKTLWTLLEDSTLTNNLNTAIVKIRITGESAAVITGDLSSIVKDVKAGKGSIGALLMDNSLSNKLNQTLVDVNVITDKLAVVSGDLGAISGQIKSGKGTIGTLIMDTTFVKDLNETLINLKTGTAGFSDNMEGLKHSIFLRKYFRKKGEIKPN